MYSVHSIKPANPDWYEVTITGPNECHIPMKRWRPDATEEMILELAQDWCDEMNRKFGFRTQSRDEALAAYKRHGATVNFDRTGIKR